MQAPGIVTLPNLPGKSHWFLTLIGSEAKGKLSPSTRCGAENPLKKRMAVAKRFPEASMLILPETAIVNYVSTPVQTMVKKEVQPIQLQVHANTE
mmetsp:Transcript_8894/g.21735  ORF Transcript_8894/g.21735 Transcript_8894/m.21735 type:complete len:95 (+) Transcript_8894:2800-3084(+)